ncbi:hypothetical protein K0504_10660 [Neiella marina]|uniref:Dinitrogenase iron-molybdenum cofactor biosynthesis protein n=1 Tax=Neiella holothuriorum TaxID=2870530 RepID=A0ABS7EHX3_9GAMM|nr:NifB/NifX family molybdenum-iron cluster-binding protein [Neiella holothuriorum]MBW8191498.1 hypothetical protein [Neiella holothuriorum]
MSDVTMDAPTISESVALRLALAAKALPQLQLAILVNTLVNQLGDVLTEKKLRSISPKQLRSWFSEGLGAHIEPPDRVQLAQAHAVLTGENIASMEAPEVPQLPALSGPKVRVAVTSNNKQQVDGHFGSCLRVLVYEVNAESYQLADVRPVTCSASGDARTSFMLELLEDCQILSTLSIGGPAAARVTRASVHPLKQATPVDADFVLSRIRQVMHEGAPAWLKKAVVDN